MAEIKVYKSDDNHFTFSVDGQESMCHVPFQNFPDRVQVANDVFLPKEQLGLPNATFPEGSYGVWRKWHRMEQGRSREVTVYNRGKVNTVETNELDARGRRVRKFTYEWDGVECDETFDSEASARAALGVKAFMNRGALGRTDEIAKVFTAVAGKSVSECCQRGDRIVVTDADGCEHVCAAEVSRELPPPDHPSGTPFKPAMRVDFKQISGPAVTEPAAE